MGLRRIFGFYAVPWSRKSPGRPPVCMRARTGRCVRTQTGETVKRIGPGYRFVQPFQACCQYVTLATGCACGYSHLSPSGTDARRFLLPLGGGPALEHRLHPRMSALVPSVPLVLLAPFPGTGGTAIFEPHLLTQAQSKHAVCFGNRKPAKCMYCQGGHIRGCIERRRRWIIAS